MPLAQPIPSPGGDRARAAVRALTAPACVTVLLLLLAGPAAAQAVVGEPFDLKFTVRDATTGQPAVPERVVLDYVAGRLNTVLDTKPEAAAFTCAGIPVKDIGQYVVTCWYQGVPYWWQKRGSDLMAGPVALDVFSVTVAKANVAVTGLNLVVRHRDSTADLELMVEITNDARPQATVFAAEGTFALQLPEGTADVEATYIRGPEPTPVPVTLSGTRALLAMPLTPGANRLRLTARVPWNEPLAVPVGSDLPVAAWSLLSAPPSLVVEATGLQAADEQSVPGFARRAGPALAAGEVHTLRLAAGVQAGRPEPLFGDKPAAGGEAAPDGAAAGRNGKGGLSAPLAVAVLLIIIGALIFVRRRRS